MIGKPTAPRLRQAVTAILATMIITAGCQQSEPPAIRAAPSASGPFGKFGYRNIKPDHIPTTEIPVAQIDGFVDCVSGSDERVAAGWIKDWFAAVSLLDRCDEWAIGVLASPTVRTSLVYILQRSQAKVRDQQFCRDKGFAVFTLIEERHSLITTYNNGFKAACNRRRAQEVADSRAKEFTDRLASIADQAQKFRKT